MPGPTRSLITPRSVFVAVVVLLLAGVAAFEIERASLVFMRTHPGEPAPSVTPPSNAVAESSDLSPSIVDPPTAVPALLFVDGDGRAMTLADFRGRVVLLNVWATWCVPCRKEMPTLDRLQAKLGGPDFQVIALSIDRQGLAVVKPFYREVGLNALGIYIDQSGKATQLLHAIGVPTTLLIDREGREVARKMGPAEWDSPETMAIIRRYLEPQPSTQPAAPRAGNSDCSRTSLALKTDMRITHGRRNARFCAEALRGFIDEIRVTPDERGNAVEIVGELAALLQLSGTKAPHSLRKRRIRQSWLRGSATNYPERWFGNENGSRVQGEAAMPKRCSR